MHSGGSNSRRVYGRSGSALVTFPEIPKELVKDCQRGEERAFEEMYQRIKGVLYGFIYSMMRNHEETDEVFQECLTHRYSIDT